MARRHDPDRFHRESGALVRWAERRRVAGVIEALALRPGHRVLEVGCGAGNVLEPIAERAEVFGIDLSGTLCAKASTRLGGGVAVAEGEALPFADASFDRVFATEVVEHVPEPETIVAELLRVVRPEGRVVVTTPHEPFADIAKTLARALGVSRLVLGANVQPAGNEWHLHRFDRNRLLSICPREGYVVQVRALPSRLLPIHHLASIRVQGSSTVAS